jgi:predicted nucleotidyltransferase
MDTRHRQAIDKLVSLHKDDPKNVALIICGSTARGALREGSDIDTYIVVTDEEFERVASRKDYFYGTWDSEAFFGVEIDGRIVGKKCLEDAVLHANEPTRATLANAYTEFSRDPEIDDLIKRIGVYPEWDFDRRIKAFNAHVRHYRYIAEHGSELGNDYLMKTSIGELVFFAARTVLARNRVLYPCRKHLFRALASCVKMPDGFIEMSRDLLDRMELQAAIRYYETVAAYFAEYDLPDQERIGLILENEWSWFTRMPSVADW